MCTRGAVCSVRCAFLCSDSVVCCGGYRALATVLLQQSEPHVRCATVSPGIDIVVGRGTHSSLVNTLYQGLKRLESNQRLDSPLAPIVCTFLDNLNPPLKYTRAKDNDGVFDIPAEILGEWARGSGADWDKDALSSTSDMLTSFEFGVTMPKDSSAAR